MKFIIIFFLFIFIEIQVSGIFSDTFGAGVLFIEMIASALLSALIIISLKQSLGETFASIAKREVSPQGALIANISRFIGAILLFLPGVFTDLMGILLQIPIFYSLMVKSLNFNHKNKEYSHENTIDMDCIIDDNGNDIFICKEANEHRKKDN